MPREPVLREVEEMEQLHRDSRFLDIYQRLAQYSSPESWQSSRARIIAGRAMGNLGAVHRSRRLLLATWRRDPNNEDARYHMFGEYYGRHGPVETLRLFDEFAANDSSLFRPAPEASESAVWLWLLRARCLAQCRDFEGATTWLTAAMTARPDEPWTYLEQAMVLEYQDRYDEALAAAEFGRSLRPQYARAIWQVTHLLMLVRRDEDALALVEPASALGQSAHLPLQLAGLYSERDRKVESLAAYDTAAARFPMAEKVMTEYLDSRRADLQHRLGRDTEAAEIARQLPGRYWKNFAERLAAPAAGTSQRLQLPVPFVRQHHMTCAPATLAAVSTYLGAPVDHLALAKAITYDGTPDHEERAWLADNGWHVREFRVTWEIAVALIGRGLPFTLVTTWTSSAHLQAVIGCDQGLGTLIIRDPYQREAHEALAAELLEQQAPFGPRGMVLIPPAERERLQGLELPDAAAFDEWFRLRRALLVHDRATAAEAAERLHAAEGGGRLALWAERQLAYYDDDPARALGAVVALRARFPDESALQLEELSLLTRLGRRVEHRERLASIMARRKVDPMIWREQIELWRVDAREHQRARRLARRFARARPVDWLAQWTLAHTYWDAGEFDRGTSLYRLAACCGDKNETAWLSYFAAARHCGRGEETLKTLRERVARLGAASAQPVITLSHALEQIDQTPAALAALTAELERRPADGELLVQLALLAGRTGGFDTALAHLAAARGRVAPADWHRTAARLAVWRGDHPAARQHHEALLASNPLDYEALAQTARLRALADGPDAALAWLAQCRERHPHFLPLRQLRLEWLRNRPPAEALSEVSEFLSLEPAHAWALREQALILLRAGEVARALDSARLAERIDPGVPNSAGIVGDVLLAQRNLEAARAAIERGLRLEIGADWLMPQLLAACPEFSARVSAVAFLYAELQRQPAPTTGFLRFREVAVGVLSPEELWSKLEALRSVHGERWEPWSACVQQAIALNRKDAACELARRAAEKFPLVPRAWLDLADAQRAADDVDSEEEALIHARALSPGWRDVGLRLASVYLRKLRLNDAVHVLENALAHDPLDAALRARLAELLWRVGRQEEAMAAGERAAEAAPGWDEPWVRLAEWSRERHEPNRVVEFARRVSVQRAGDPDARRQLARVLTEHGNHRDALDESAAAVRLAPHDIESHDLQAYILVQLGRRDDALAACRPPSLGDPPPYRLSARAAWVRWHFGEQNAAIEAMQAVAAGHPDHAWAWQQLAEWWSATGDNVRAAEAAQRYADLRPAEPAAWSWVASLKIAARDDAAALPLLEKALSLEPGYRYAAFNLLKLSCEQSRWEQAGRALAIVRQHHSRWFALRCETMYHRWRRDKSAAIAALRDLCRVPLHETSWLIEAADEVTSTGWAADAEALLRSLIPEKDCNPEVGAIWMRARLGRATFARPRVRWLERSGAGELLRHAAWRVYLEWLAQRNNTGVLRWHLWRRGKWLACNDATWGTVSFVLMNLHWYRRVVRWMDDWRERNAVEPWMLSNLAHSLSALDRQAEFEQVVASALLLPSDHTRASFVAWAACIAANRGRYDEASRLLAGFENHRNNEFAALTAAHAQSLVDLGMAAPDERRGKFAGTRSSLQASLRANAGAAAVSYMAREHRRTLLRAAQLAASPWRWWYRIPMPQLWRPAGMGAIACVIIALIIVAAIATAKAPVFLAIVVFWMLRAFFDAKRSG